MKGKLIIAILLMIALLCVSLPALADNVSGLYSYTIKGNGTITITDYDWNTAPEMFLFQI